MQNESDSNSLRVNDLVRHRPVFFRALANAVKNNHLQKWKADELRKSYILDCKEDK